MYIYIWQKNFSSPPSPIVLQGSIWACKLGHSDNWRGCVCVCVRACLLRESARWESVHWDIVFCKSVCLLGVFVFWGRVVAERDCSLRECVLEFVCRRGCVCLLRDCVCWESVYVGRVILSREECSLTKCVCVLCFTDAYIIRRGKGSSTSSPKAQETAAHIGYHSQ